MEGMEATPERILDAAGQVFAEKGFEEATVREICARAGANVAAVNYHFRDKQTLYLEAVKRAHCQRGATTEPTWPPEASPEDKLAGFVAEMMHDMLDRERPAWHVELLMREMARPTEACVELVRSYIGPRFALLMEIVDAFLPPPMPLEERHLHAFSIIGQCLLFRFHQPVGRLLVGDEEFQRLADASLLAQHITRFSLHALQGAGQPAEEARK